MRAATQQPPLLSPLTQDDLGALQIHLPALRIVSYRGPGVGGGVSASLGPLTRQLGTKVQWIACSGVPSATDQQIPGFSFFTPEIPQSVQEHHLAAVYDYLWPLMHGLPERAKFDHEAWVSFRKLSQLLAHQSLSISARSFPTLIWLHDFETALVAPLLAHEAGIIVSQFWHAPWPQPEVIIHSPVGRELVQALLSNRLLGFHTFEYATNFLSTVKALFPDAVIDAETSEVRVQGLCTKVVSMPLGLDFPYWQRLAKGARVEAEALIVKHRLAQQIVLGVDRLDYTKGVLEKINALEKFLEMYPEWHRRFHYVQLAQPALAKTESFDQYRLQVLARVDEVNRRFAGDLWQPIVWIEGQIPHTELAAWYQTADVVAVTPIRDGLNLIAKEFVACRLDEEGALVLGKQAGSAAELMSGAVLVDSLDAEDVAQGIFAALGMGVEEKRRRMLSMRHVTGWNRLHDWACGFLRQAIIGPQSNS